MDRREFLALVGCSALGLTAAAMGGLDRALLWAASEESTSSTQLKTLEAAVERIVPHTEPVLKRLAAETARTLAERSKSDPALRSTLEDVISELNDKAQKLYNKPFADLIAERQIVVMEKVQDSRSFQHLVNQVLASYYDKPEVWHALGYPGPVNDHDHMEGGYLARGYDKLDW